MLAERSRIGLSGPHDRGTATLGGSKIDSPGGRGYTPRQVSVSRRSSWRRYPAADGWREHRPTIAESRHTFMALSTDVNLPKDHPAQFADRCVVCGRPEPGSTVRLMTGSIGWWTWMLWTFGRPFVVKAPACPRCSWLLHLRRLIGLLLTVVFAVPGVLATVAASAGTRRGSRKAVGNVTARFRVPRAADYLRSRFSPPAQYHRLQRLRSITNLATPTWRMSLRH